MYQVFDNGKPADCHNHDVHSSWDNSKFRSFEEAVEYAKDWTCFYGTGLMFKLNEPEDYSGYGDMIEIRG